MGPGEADDKEATVLNRVVRWTKDGLEYEADPRQGEKLLRDLKLEGEGVKAAATPGVKANREQLDVEYSGAGQADAIPRRRRSGKLSSFR